jgi:hypothetical protein
MKKQFKRLGVALLISAGCFIATVIWFRSGETDLDTHHEKAPVARLNQASNEVQRKPLKRVIWESLSRNDELYSGEAIRTASNAEAQIYFVKNGATVHLEPDSLIVLEENEKGLSLDFLQGNMFVQDGADMTLKTGSGEIDLKSADMSLSKGRDGKVDLEVHKGSAQLKQGNQNLALDKNKAAILGESGVSVERDRMQVLSPSAGEVLLLNISKGEKVPISWQRLSNDYRVEIEVGSSRANLRRLDGTQAAGDLGRLQFNEKPGRWFLKLTAKSQLPDHPPLTSSVVPFVIQAKSAPLLVRPAAGATVLKSAAEEKVKMQWTNRHDFASQVLEVAADPRFKENVQRKTLGGGAIDTEMDLQDGAYYWRVTGFLKTKAKTEALSSPAAKFSVNSKWELKPPALIQPPSLSRLAYADVQRTGVMLKWKAPEGVKRFHALVQKIGLNGAETLADQTTQNFFLKLNDLKPGTYKWKVASLDAKSTTSKDSEVFEFTVDQVPRLEWASTEDEYEYPTPGPTLMAQWKPLLPAPASYRFRLTEADQAPDANGWQTTRQSFFDAKVPTDGTFQIEVEARNEKGQTIAATPPRSMLVRRKPLLPAPLWASDAPDVFKADTRGNVSFGWQEVKGADHYVMILQTPDGQVVKEQPVDRNIASVNRLKPGEYEVKLKTVDELKRPGPDSITKKIEVPDTSDIRAPKIKAMKVK